MTDRERMIAGKFYNAASPQLARDRTRARMLADRFNKTHARSLRRRSRLIAKLFPNADVKGAFFEPNIRVEYGYNTRFGENFYMNFDCQLLDVAPIAIGKNAMFGPRVTLATPMHPLVGSERAIQDYPDGFHDIEYARPIVIGDNVWLASGVIVCGGVTIGDNAVVAAGSVVTRDIPAGMLAAGVPCRVLRPITDADRVNPWATYEKQGDADHE